MADAVDDDDNSTIEPLLPLMTIDDVKQRLSTFLANNSYSDIGTVDIPKMGKLHRVDKPWGDSTLGIALPPTDDAEFFDALNSVVLPERLSAVWHQDTKDIEVIWTALPLSDDQIEIAGRKFTFVYSGKKYRCEFGESSDRLKLLSAFSMPITNPSATNFRNIQSFSRMAHKQVNAAEDATEYHPRSFWIKNVRLSEKNAIKMIECLNFYLSYYDTKSPRVLVHDIHDPTNPRTRYIASSFPEVIAGKALDENLMSFWDATRQPNPILRFIFFYRIIEYAASHYVDTSIRAKIGKILSNPAIAMNVQRSIDEVLCAYDGARGEDVPRFNSLLQHSVSPDVIWKEIDQNKAIFSETVTFDGGFKLQALLDKSETSATFAKGGIIKFANSIRGLRNVLAHGRDQNTSTAITPTPRNMKYLSAWVNVIAAAAGEVVLYGSDT